MANEKKVDTEGATQILKAPAREKIKKPEKPKEPPRGIAELGHEDKEKIGAMLTVTLRKIAEELNLKPEDALGYADKLLRIGLEKQARQEAEAITTEVTPAPSRPEEVIQTPKKPREEPQDYQEMLSQLEDLLPPMKPFIEIAKKADPSSLVGSALTMIDAVELGIKIQNSSEAQKNKIIKEKFWTPGLPNLGNVAIPSYALRTLKKNNLENEVRALIEKTYLEKGPKAGTIEDNLFSANQKYIRDFARFVIQSAMRNGYPRAWIEKVATVTQDNWIDKYSSLPGVQPKEKPIEYDNKTKEIPTVELRKALDEMKQGLRLEQEDTAETLIPDTTKTEIKPSPFAATDKAPSKIPPRPAIIVPQPQKDTSSKPPYSKKEPLKSSSKPTPTIESSFISDAGPAKAQIKEGEGAKEKPRIIPRKFKTGDILEAQELGEIKINRTILLSGKDPVYFINTSLKGPMRLTQTELLKYNPTKVSEWEVKKPKTPPPSKPSTLPPSKPVIKPPSSAKKTEPPKETPKSEAKQTEAAKEGRKIHENLKPKSRFIYTPPDASKSPLAVFETIQNVEGKSFYSFKVYNGKKGEAPEIIWLTAQEVNQAMKPITRRSQQSELKEAIVEGADIGAQVGLGVLSDLLFFMG
jgi:hypothetical protein